MHQNIRAVQNNPYSELEICQQNDEYIHIETNEQILGILTCN